MSKILVRRSQLVDLKKSGVNMKHATSSNTLVEEQLHLTLSHSKEMMGSQNLENTIPFILWNDYWNKVGIYGSHRDIAFRPTSSLRYTRGRKVYVDFGCNVGKETSIPHPAIVIYNFAETMIVVPTTSDDGSPFTEEMENALIHCPKDGNIFPQDTIINLHQIRCISKNRIISDLQCSVQDYFLPNQKIDELNRRIGHMIIPYRANLKTCIEIKLTHLYSPNVFHELRTSNRQIEILEERIFELEKKTRESAK